MSRQVYISIDGNNIGKHLEKYIITDDVSGLQIYSGEITKRIAIIADMISECDGKVFMAGGDNILAQIRWDRVKDTIGHITKISSEEISYSVGVGNTPRDAYLALKYSKGCDYPIYYSNGAMQRISDFE